MLLLIVKTHFLRKFTLLSKSRTKLKLIFRGDSRYTVILISLTTKSQRQQNFRVINVIENNILSEYF